MVNAEKGGEKEAALAAVRRGSVHDELQRSLDVSSLPVTRETFTEFKERFEKYVSDFFEIYTLTCTYNVLMNIFFCAEASALKN